MVESVEMTKKIVVYTCITGSYDELLEPVEIEEGVDYYCVSDRPPKQESVWAYLPLPRDFGSPSLNNRYVKMHPHILFPDYEFSLYVDGNIRIMANVSDLVFEAMKVSVLALYQHSYRSCVYQEAVECSLLGHDWLWRISRQMRRYSREGFPFSDGLYENNVIIRDNSDQKLKNLMDLWWDEYSNYVKRDQLSLVFLSWKKSLKIHNLGPSDPRGDNNIFKLKSVHVDNSFSIRFCRFINRWLIKFGFFRVPGRF
ncbi:MAG: hypothetical protein C0621_11070 [Desulfuromonas sp.]|nr:MAG: hypothetical protein C0621_11070 [Desulfuromonas sp.]